jgi:hypothetical protein
MVVGNVRVTSGETGGVITLNANDPAGGSIGRQLDAGGHGNGTFVFTGTAVVIAPNQTVTVSQSALTVGAATAFVELWGS